MLRSFYTTKLHTIFHSTKFFVYFLHKKWNMPIISLFSEASENSEYSENSEFPDFS